MSNYLGAIKASISCCFGTGFCSFCCATCPTCRGSTSTRAVFILFVLLNLILSIILLIPDFENLLMKIPNFCRNSNEQNDRFFPIDCSKIMGPFAVYRLAFGMMLFFLLFSLLMIKVKSSNEVRGKIQNGFWALKLILILIFISGSFLFPQYQFDFIVSIIGLIGGFLFILIQLLILVGFTYAWNESWVEQVESGSRKHGYGLLLSTFLFYAMSIGGAILLYYHYGFSFLICTENAIFITSNMIICVAFSILSISPLIRKYNNSCGLLQSSFVTFYITYFTWSAMSDNPNRECNPRIILFQFSNTTSSTIPISNQQNYLADPVTLVALLLFVSTLIHSMVATTRNSRAKRFFLSTSIDSTILDEAQLVNSISDNKWLLGSEDQHRQRVYNDERASVSYNYSLFHLFLISAVLFNMMNLTNWNQPPSSSSQFWTKSEVSLWVKMTSTWFCSSLYIWTSISPIIFRNRDFS